MPESLCQRQLNQQVATVASRVVISVVAAGVHDSEPGIWGGLFGAAEKLKYMCQPQSGRSRVLPQESV